MYSPIRQRRSTGNPLIVNTKRKHNPVIQNVCFLYDNYLLIFSPPFDNSLMKMNIVLTREVKNNSGMGTGHKEPRRDRREKKS
jgi:hypothetical protein